jgi:Winged helix DNA-binding domain
MAKKKRGDGSGSKPEKKLQRVRQRLDEVQELYVEAQKRGEQAIDKARLRADKWLQEAADRVGKRATALERAEARLRKGMASADADVPDSTIVEVVEVLEIAAGDPASIVILAGREALALQALRRVQKDAGVTAQEWRSAAGMSGTTFARSREALVRYGLVNQDGEPGRNTRYSLTEAGALFDLEAITEP